MTDLANYLVSTAQALERAIADNNDKGAMEILRKLVTVPEDDEPRLAAAARAARLWLFRDEPRFKGKTDNEIAIASRFVVACVTLTGFVEHQADDMIVKMFEHTNNDFDMVTAMLLMLTNQIAASLLGRAAALKGNPQDFLLEACPKLGRDLVGMAHDKMIELLADDT